ncbi:hypothetical protein GUITHDRAFT_155090 [Guillardia theta CCMP2712]|uniref:Uncharacterized protein n=1 Tax=Guillardia theta (strain CCMP2712) TaxID=905079 RepID=L1IMH5_GUITC|nr:hypothetical protein GUITHDRAFT_155090 [Guillardia theta CCMP2712]EKX37005.1 hypothetical protein GUITHDRAFT_155090 [Guillardia theta CCMP2712]|eukprot:XP_005823985.1 hypothetical protein GUITHDRAFT_155090 [Guillardia theta CCMP2712]
MGSIVSVSSIPTILPVSGQVLIPSQCPSAQRRHRVHRSNSLTHEKPLRIHHKKFAEICRNDQEKTTFSRSCSDHVLCQRKDRLEVETPGKVMAKPSNRLKCPRA